MTDAEMAAHLRERGYRVEEPLEELPELAVGQMWWNDKPTTECRAVTVVEEWIGYRLGTPCVFTSTPNAFRAWARRTGARPL